MKLSVVFLVLIFATMGLAQAPAGGRKPLTREQLMRLVAAGMESTRLTETVAERGIGFALTAQDMHGLRQAGAQPDLLKVVAEAALAQSGEPLSKDLLPHLVSAGTDETKLIQAIQKRGVDAPLAAEDFERLQQLGATENVLKVLREANPKPLDADQVLSLLTSGVSSDRVRVLVERRGVSFRPTDDYLETLRIAGADETLVETIRKSTVRGDISVESLPGAEVQVDGHLQGRADSQGQLAIRNVLPGEYRLRVSLAGHLDYNRVVVVASKQVTQVIAELEGKPGNLKVNPKDGLKYVWIPSGTFMMGCSPGDSECDADEKPSHQVRITKGFWIGQTEVTVEAFSRFTNQTGAKMPEPPKFNPGWSNRVMPIVNVSWDDAHTYCEWTKGRLPTEAEWEYAARGGSTQARYGVLDEVAWCSKNSGPQANAVAQKRANGFGFFDALGNVREWVNDWYGAEYYQNSPAPDSQGPAGGEGRVLRGGSWLDIPRVVRVSGRDRGLPEEKNVVSGLRCVWEMGSP